MNECGERMKVRSEVILHRRGDDYREAQLYDGRGVVGLDVYFRETTRLPTTVMRYVLDPGTAEGSHLHETGNPESCSAESSDELYLVIAGELVFTLDGEVTSLAAGDAAYAPAGSRHGIVNESSTPAEIVLIFGAPVPQHASTS